MCYEGYEDQIYIYIHFNIHTHPHSHLHLHIHLHSHLHLHLHVHLHLHLQIDGAYSRSIERHFYFLRFPVPNCLYVLQNKCSALLVRIYILMFKSDSAPKIQASKGNGHGKDLT